MTWTKTAPLFIEVAEVGTQSRRTRVLEDAQPFPDVAQVQSVVETPHHVVPHLRDLQHLRQLLQVACACMSYISLYWRSATAFATVLVGSLAQQHL